MPREGDTVTPSNARMCIFNVVKTHCGAIIYPEMHTRPRFE
jgi:hypothetical protein